jgi:HPt (histidine-containing phosphotransfer) domain-containing protein
MSRSKAELLESIEAQRAEYQRTLPAKVAHCEALWRDARQAPGEPERLGELERLAHDLHGTAGTYGFHALSRAGHALELAVRALMDAGVPLTGEQERQITQALDTVRLSLP